MKFSSVWARLMSLVLVFALMLAAGQSGSQLKGNADDSIHPVQQTEVRNPNPPKTVITRGQKATIILHGLMVGRIKPRAQDPGKFERFEVGIVNRAPAHKFSFSVHGNPLACTNSGVFISEISLDKKNTYDFTVIDKDNNPAGAIRERLLSDSSLFGKYEAYKNILNVEEMSKKEISKMKYRDAFSHVFNIHDGDLKMICSTGRIVARKKEGESTSEQDIYRKESIAEVVGVEITLSQGQALILTNRKNETLWRHEYCEDGKAEARLINLRRSHYNEETGIYTTSKEYGCKCSHENENQDDPTDFQLYYYLVFNVDRPERFELKNLDKCAVRNSRTIPPYKCGMVCINEGSGPVTIE